MTTGFVSLIPPVSLVVAAILAVPATILGWRGSTGRSAPGVRGIKTAVTAVLLVGLVIQLLLEFADHPWFHVAMAIGLALTVIADWFLAPVDNRKTFPAGLRAFLLGYLIYGVAILVTVISSSGAPGAGLPWPGGRASPWPIVAGAYAVAGAVSIGQYRFLAGVPRELKTAVIAYVAVAANLLAAGIVTAVLAGAPSFRVLILLGALSIYLSDSLIAWNLFRRPIPGYELWIMPTYYIGQIAIVGALLGSI